MFVDAKDAFLLRSETKIKLEHHRSKKRIVGFEIIKGGVLSVFSKKKRIRNTRTPTTTAIMKINFLLNIFPSYEVISYQKTGLSRTIII